MAAAAEVGGAVQKRVALGLALGIVGAIVAGFLFDLFGAGGVSVRPTHASA